MADAADSKSVTLKSVRVQVPPPARALKYQRFRAFFAPEKQQKRGPEQGPGNDLGTTWQGANPSAARKNNLFLTTRNQLR